MSKQFMYASFDMKMKMYSRPMLVQTDEAMQRAWSDQINGKKGYDNPLAMHPEDHCLYKIGIYDDATGKVSPIEPHVALGKAIDFVRGEDRE